ncbi:MAG: stage 0 sporulation family protein [Deltaproteobacteria bacterium]|nr:stage 0 sporulation family protein [Deltaproteobacteria bacterium]
MVNIVGVRFKKACKIYDFSTNSLELKFGDRVVVETERGMSIGWVAYGPVEKDETQYKQGLKKVIRRADENDAERFEFNKEREADAFKICADKIKAYNLPMKLIAVEYLFDTSKAIFSFISEQRVDFRELVKDLANEFHTRIEMKQVGVRDETKMLGGIGPCGRELCCSSFLTEFEAVTVKMAKEQNINLNPAKISGVCGRLMCCLTYEAQGADNAAPHNGCCNHNKNAENPPSSETAPRTDN